VGSGERARATGATGSRRATVAAGCAARARPITPKLLGASVSLAGSFGAAPVFAPFINGESGGSPPAIGVLVAEPGEVAALGEDVAVLGAVAVLARAAAGEGRAVARAGDGVRVADAAGACGEIARARGAALAIAALGEGVAVARASGGGGKLVFVRSGGGGGCARPGASDGRAPAALSGGVDGAFNGGLTAASNGPGGAAFNGGLGEVVEGSLAGVPGAAGGLTMFGLRRGFSELSRCASGMKLTSSATRLAGNHSAQPLRQTKVVAPSAPLASNAQSARSLPEACLPSLVSQ
jgi:hypothetical protein